MVFKGIDGIKPADPKIRNLTDLWLLDSVENENDPSALTLTYSPVKTFKSGLVNNWGSYYIDMVTQMRRGATFPTRLRVRPAKTQISLCIYAV